LAWLRPIAYFSRDKLRLMSRKNRTGIAFAIVSKVCNGALVTDVRARLALGCNCRVDSRDQLGVGVRINAPVFSETARDALTG